jgi:hypothetical protein
MLKLVVPVANGNQVYWTSQYNIWQGVCNFEIAILEKPICGKLFSLKASVNKFVSINFWKPLWLFGEIVISEYFLKLYLSYHPGIGNVMPFLQEFYTLVITKVLLTAWTSQEVRGAQPVTVHKCTQPCMQTHKMGSTHFECSNHAWSYICSN